MVEADSLSGSLLRRDRVAALFGVGSAGLLAASLRWAHHWSPVAVVIVTAWAVATVSALTISIWSLRTRRSSRALARVGVSLAGVSLLALCLAGLLYAAGIDAAGACGGG